jgi:23S rRNA (cytosine1962-C5)-methyltransferase
MYKEVRLRKGKEESLRRFHPWVFSGAILSMDDGIQEGDVVRVVTVSGDFIAVGHYQQGSIAVRVLSFSDVDIDDAFFASRLRSALHMREANGIACCAEGDIYRLVHGEGDNLPGLIVDVYGRTAVMQAHSIGMHLMRKQIAQVLADVMDSRISHIYYKSETTLPFMTADDMAGFLVGGSEDNVAVENGLKFRVDWLKGQKTGFFVDQRENRTLLEKYARGRRVLNMFCYTGGFSVYAMRGGAELVHSVDSSEKAIALTRQNVEMNFGSDPRHEAFCVDAFKFLDGIPRQPQENQEKGYDLVILDPPAFAKHRGALKNALRAYQRLNAAAIAKVAPGGFVFTFSCSQVVDKEAFALAVFSAAAETGRSVRILDRLNQPADHSVNIYHPEGEYLKGLLLYVE